MNATLQHRQVRANDIEFHVALAGEGKEPAVLCLHGFPEGSASWGPVAQELGETNAVWVPDLRGYPGSAQPRSGYDVFTLTDDVKALIEVLGLDRPLLVAHDWGGAMGWIFAHRFPALIRGLVVVNCPHLRTLERAILHFENLQPLRIPWLYFFQVPWLPERLLASNPGRALLRWTFVQRHGDKSRVNRRLIDEVVSRFQRSSDMRGPLEYYREMAKTTLLPHRRQRLNSVFAKPIEVPTTVVWGVKDCALPASMAVKSGRDAGREIDWRPLPGVDHFVNLEAPRTLVSEIRRALDLAG